MGRGHLCTVQPSIDPNDGPSLVGQPPCLILPEPRRKTDSAADFFVVIQPAQVLWGGDHPVLHPPALGSLAHIKDDHPVRFSGQSLEVADGLFVRHQVEISAGLESQVGFGRSGLGRAGPGPTIGIPTNDRRRTERTHRENLMMSPRAGFPMGVTEFRLATPRFPARTRPQLGGRR